MRTIGIQGIGSFEGPGNAPRFFNRTGAATALGYVGFVDDIQSDAASTTLALGLAGIVKPATAHLTQPGRIPAVCVEAGVADDGEGRWAVAQDASGLVIQILVESTTDVALGDPLKIVDAQYYLVKATTGADEFVAIALEAKTANSAAVMWCRLLPLQMSSAD